MTLPRSFQQRFVAAAFAITALAGAVPSAKANMKVCNNTNQTILYSHTFQISTNVCAEGWADTAWFFINAHTCSNVFNGNVTNIIFWQYAETSTGIVWPGSGNWSIPAAGHTNMCFNAMQTYCNSNPVTACRQNAPHSFFKSSSDNPTVTYQF